MRGRRRRGTRQERGEKTVDSGRGRREREGGDYGEKGGGRALTVLVTVADLTKQIG